MSYAQGPTRIRELGAIEVLDVSFKILTRNFATLVKTAVVIVVPLQIANAVIAAVTAPELLANPFGSGPTEEELEDVDPLAATVGVLAMTAIAGVGVILATAACFRAASEAYLGGRPEWRESLGFAIQRLGRTLWLVFLMAILLMLAFLALFVPGLWLMVAWSVALPALLLEDVRGRRALGRSYRLVRGRWWRTFWAFFLNLGLVAGTAGGLIVVVLSIPLVAVEPDTLAGVAINAFANIVANGLLLPFQAIVIAVVYYDLRARKEGLDLDQLGAQLGVQPTEDAPARAIQGGFVPPAPGPTYHPPGAPPGGWAAPGQTPPGSPPWDEPRT
jgi:hypothetical protein